MKSAETRKNAFLFFISLVTVFVFVLVGNRIAPYMIDNDNIYFKTMASGEMTGTPEPHMYYIGMVFGLLVTSLYKLTGNGVPWFGGLLIVAIALVLVYVMYRILKETNKLYTAVALYAVLTCVLVCFFYRFFAELQFTIASGMLGAGAVFALLLVDMDKGFKENWSCIVLFFVFSLFSYSVRSNGFIMLFPFIGMVFLSKFLDLIVPLIKQKKNVFKNLSVFGTFFVTAVAFVLALGVNVVVDHVGYSSEEWQEFDFYTERSTIIVDYNGLPDYESNKDLYDKHGVTRSSFEAADHHYNLLLDPNIDGEFFDEAATRSEELKKAAEPAFGVRIKETFQDIVARNLKEYDDRPINILVFWMYLVIVVAGLLSRKFRMLLDVVFIGFARMVDWFYLVYNGRYPFRVTQIVYFAELFALIAIVINYRVWELPSIKIKERALRPLTALMLVGIVAASIRFGLPVMKDVKAKTEAFGTLSTSFVELEAYLEAHPDNFYYFDMSNLHYRENTLDTRPRPYENYIYMGGWLTSSPWYNHKLAEHGIENPAQAIIERDDIFIIYQVTDGYTRDFLDDFFKEHYPGTVVEKADELVTSNGFVYEFLSVHD